MSKKFQISEKIKWLCPVCNNESLKIVNDKFFDEETSETKTFKNDTDWEIEWITLNFSGLLKCNSCENFIFFCGTGAVEHYSYVDNFSGEYEEGFYHVYSPTFFQPEINLFPISLNCPELISEEIKKSFKLYWFDLASCANRIRTSIELIMNHFKITKTHKGTNGKRTRLTLHKRIQKFKLKNDEVGKLLEAIKWIGNSGSHVGNLESIDVLETYQLLELSLKKLFDNEEANLKKFQKK